MVQYHSIVWYFEQLKIIPYFRSSGMFFFIFTGDNKNFQCYQNDTLILAIMSFSKFYHVKNLITSVAKICESAFVENQLDMFLTSG